MNQHDQDYWTKLFDSIKVDWQGITTKLITLVEKSTQQIETSKNEVASLKQELKKLERNGSASPFV